MDNYQIAMLAISGLVLVVTVLGTWGRGPKPGKRSKTKLPPGVIAFPKGGPVPIAVEIEVEPGPKIIKVKTNDLGLNICGYCAHAYTSSGLCADCGHWTSHVGGFAVAHEGRKPTRQEVVAFVRRRRRG